MNEERSKREELQEPLYCSIRCAKEGKGIFEGPAILEYNYCKNHQCANFCKANSSCEISQENKKI